MKPSNLEAFREACSRYFNVTGESVDKAFVFYVGATTESVAPSAEDMEWATLSMRERSTHMDTVMDLVSTDIEAACHVAEAFKQPDLILDALADSPGTQEVKP